MVKVGKKIAKHRIAILIIGFLLLIPSAFGYFNTRVNYDILYYLPDNIDTMKGQEILMDDFGKGAFAIEVVEGMTTKEVTDVKKKIEAVDGVADVIWYDSISDLSVPIDSLPDKIKDIFQKDDSTLMAIFFDDTTSADNTMDAITEIRSITNKQCYLSSMSAVVTDIKALSEKETSMYVLIAIPILSIKNTGRIQQFVQRARTMDVSTTAISTYIEVSFSESALISVTTADILLR